MPSMIKKMLSMVMDNFLPMRCGSAYLMESSDCLLPGIMSVYITKEIPEERKERNLTPDVSYR